MSIPGLQPLLFVGLKTDIRYNVHFVDNEDLLYPVGNVFAIHNITQRKQTILKLPDKTTQISLICVSPNRKIIAFCEKGERPCILLYDAATHKRKKTLGIPTNAEVGAAEFAHITFTHDSKTLLAVTGAPDWMLLSYNWEKGKVESSCKAINTNGTGTVTQICANPVDLATLALIGDGLLRLMTCAENVWRQWGFNKADQITFCSATWLAQDRFVAGTTNGRLYVIEAGELKSIYMANQVTEIVIKPKDETQQQQQPSFTNILEGIVSNEPGLDVKCLIDFRKGFAYACGIGTVHMFEKKTASSYVKRNMFIVPPVTFREGPEYEMLTAIQQIAINPLVDRMVVTTKRSQLYEVQLWEQTIAQQPEIQFSQLGQGLHHGSISALAMCSWKPVFMTCGAEDRTVRLWNYETETLELCKQYHEDIHGLSLHPTAMYALVSFSDKLRFLAVMIDDLEPMREFSIRYCKTIAFSRLGHLFAAVNGNTIQVYSSITFQNMFNLRGHYGKIQALSWSGADDKLLSCGSEGTVYEWDIHGTEGIRRGELITKNCSYMSVVVTGDGKTTYAVGTDGQVRQMTEGVLARDVTLCPGGILNAVALSQSDMMLFVSGMKGTIFSVNIPLLETAEYNEYKYHSDSVTQLSLTYDDKYLISCSDDGSMCMWKLLSSEGKTVIIDPNYAPCKHILIPQVDLIEKITIIKELTIRMKELVTEHVYQIRQLETSHQAKIADIHTGYSVTMKELKEKNEREEFEHSQEINTLNLNIVKMKQAHEQTIHELEGYYNTKLIGEYDKYRELEDILASVRKQDEEQFEKLVLSKKEEITKLVNEYTEQINDRNSQIEMLTEELAQKVKEHEIIKQQIEDDADKELYDIRLQYEAQIKEEKEQNVFLRGEAGVLRKKFIMTQKEIEKLKHNIQTMETEQVKFKNIIVTLEKDISDLKKEIVERDATIHDKERRIYDLKRKNQELEKFKFVLNYKIKELKGQIEPKDIEIRNQKEQIDDMIKELENLQRIINNLELQRRELREKLIATEQEVKIQHDKVRHCKTLIKKMKVDLHNLSSLIQQPSKLKTKIKEMHHKYNVGKDFKLSQAEDMEAKNEFLRQREYLERTVHGLQNAISKNVPGMQTDKVKLIEQNSTLITEINNLRTQLKQEKLYNRKLESLFGLSTRLPSEAQEKLNIAVASKQEIFDKYKGIIEGLEKSIVALKDENMRLISKLSNDIKYESDVSDTEK